MMNIWKSDIYRLGKNKLFYGILGFTCIIASMFMALIRHDISLGISVFGSITSFKKAEDIIRISIMYKKGLGVLISILISVFVGQEYQWQTWQHKWITNKSRTSIYISKSILSSAISVLIFLAFQGVALLTSAQILKIFRVEYIVMVTNGVFIYAALGSVICLLSMMIKSNIASIITCLCYVLFSEILSSIAMNISKFSDKALKLAEWCIRHSVYGMSLAAYNATNFTNPTNLIANILVNSFVIILITTGLGLLFFRNYEL